MDTKAGPAVLTESTSGIPSSKVVVVHAGARDAYQLALALSEANLLDVLVTDLLWPRDSTWARHLLTKLSAGLRELLLRRSAANLPFDQVRLCFLSGLRCLILDKLSFPFKVRRRSTRSMDSTLGRTAGRRARETGAGLLSYSYCAFDALSDFQSRAMIFQAHPHPSTMRRILKEELAAHPECADSLKQEWELALPDDDYRRLVAETTLASHYLVASSFTRQSLVEHGTPFRDVTVIPYGVDLVRFHPPKTARPRYLRDPLRLLFVGRINQRKGIKYLLEALDLLDTAHVHLTICGRVVDDLKLFRPFGDRIHIRPSVNDSELVAAYQQADLFIFPSVGEGFGQVLLEALASGLPVLSTSHTAAPDLISDGVQGFIVEPRRSDLLADRIAWAAEHPAELAEMSREARLRAESFTWEEFRRKTVAAVRQHLITRSAEVTQTHKGPN